MMNQRKKEGDDGRLEKGRCHVGPTSDVDGTSGASTGKRELDEGEDNLRRVEELTMTINYINTK